MKTPRRSFERVPVALTGARGAPYALVDTLCSLNAHGNAEYEYSKYKKIKYNEYYEKYLPVNRKKLRRNT